MNNRTVNNFEKIQYILHYYNTNTVINILYTSYESSNGDLYYRALLRVILDYYKGKIQFEKLDINNQPLSDSNYIRNDFILYVAFGVINNGNLNITSLSTISILVRRAIANNSSDTLLEFLLKCLLASAPESRLNDKEYRNTIPKVNKPANYIDLFEDVDV